MIIFNQARSMFMKKLLLISVSVAAVFAVFAIVYHFASDNMILAGRGCCSRHGGVCGCWGGRAKCCDGTLSPTCQCFMDEDKGLHL